MITEIVQKHIPFEYLQKLKLGIGRLSDLEIDEIRLARGNIESIVAAAAWTAIFTPNTAPGIFPVGYDFLLTSVIITNGVVGATTVDLYDGPAIAAATWRGAYYMPAQGTNQWNPYVIYNDQIGAAATAAGAAPNDVTVEVGGILIPM